jgi:hypothetical protein
MNKKTVKLLRLNRDTLHALTGANLLRAAGGRPTTGCTDACTYTCKPCTKFCN